jgi:hypothetical protein
MAMTTRLMSAGRFARLTLCAAALLALPLAGCNDPLRVADPDIVPPVNLDDPAALPTLRAGAIGDFTIAYAGSGADGSGGTVEGVIMYGGMLADEWVNSETFPTRIEVDSRGPIRTDNANVTLWFRNMHRARRAAEIAAAKYVALSDETTQSGYPEVLSLAGYVYLFLAETWCSGVPVSSVDATGSVFTYGVPLTTKQLLDTAAARFDAASAAATALPGTGATRASLIRLAAVGKARAMLDTGNVAGAAALVTPALVPTSFNYLVQHTENTARENNGIFNGNVTFERYSVANGEGINGIKFRDGDPRTPFERTVSATTGPDVGFDNVTPQYDNLRYGDRKASTTVATGAEARLIEAEAALRAADTLTNTSVFLTKLNELRAAPPTYFNSNRAAVAPVAPMTALTTADQTAAGGAVKLLFNERARWLWLTAHRLGDLRRMVRQYLFAAISVFPTGPYFKSQQPTYGNDVNLPVPEEEENNPNFHQCYDRNP